MTDDLELMEDIVEEARYDWIDMGHAMGVVNIVEGGEDRLALLRRAGTLIVRLVREGRLVPGDIGKAPGEFVPWQLSPQAAAAAIDEYVNEVVGGSKPIEPWQPCLFDAPEPDN
jgi:hypothetical protein